VEFGANLDGTLHFTNISMLDWVKSFIIEHPTWITVLSMNNDDETGEDKDATNQLTSDVNSWRHYPDCQMSHRSVTRSPSRPELEAMSRPPSEHVAWPTLQRQRYSSCWPLDTSRHAWTLGGDATVLDDYRYVSDERRLKNAASNAEDVFPSLHF